MKRIRTSATSRQEMSKRPMTQSERAKLQPRDTRGRFAGFDTVMVIDEFGNPGVEPKRSETKFGYAISVTENPDAFGTLTDDNRWNSNHERKARDDHSKQLSMVRKISTQNVRTYAFYVDKNDPPKEWKASDRRKLMLGMLDYSLDKTLPETKGDVFVVVDHHTAYRGAVRPLIQSKSKPWKIVDGDKFDSHEGDWADVLQTHDYVASAVRGNVEIGDPRRTKVLGTKIHKIEDGELNVRCNYAGYRGLADNAAPDPSSGLDPDLRGLADNAAPDPSSGLSQQRGPFTDI